MEQLIEFVCKVLLRNKNNKCIRSVIDNNLNLLNILQYVCCDMR